MWKTIFRKNINNCIYCPFIRVYSVMKVIVLEVRFACVVFVTFIWEGNYSSEF